MSPLMREWGPHDNKLVSEPGPEALPKPSLGTHLLVAMGQEVCATFSDQSPSRHAPALVAGLGAPGPLPPTRATLAPP